ncbi:hypothetical protein HOF65_07035 [bacterium]|nr:hypothetical protein [bacterium]MBT3853672.1 hypothetical protein [bacterium]MBT4633036.1 hypothetical protein [bacterium]MBT5491979.1 hypothetical protein [bacterium]MBT6778384.1 hypothetical protein [bacterium]
MFQISGSITETVQILVQLVIFSSILIVSKLLIFISVGALLIASLTSLITTVNAASVVSESLSVALTLIL